MITEFPPYLSPLLAGFPLNGGRVQSISVNPTNRDHIVVANEFGGLWKTENAGKDWNHLDLYTVSAIDVAYSLDGKIILATLERDNSLPNGGGIWYSDDGGKKWYPKGEIPNHKRIPARKSAYGIAFDPYKANRVYVGTDYGIATSINNGLDWSHEMLETTSSVWSDKKQNSVQSVLALHGDNVIAVCRGTLFLRKGTAGWKRILKPSWPLPYYWWISGFKNIDTWSSSEGDNVLTVTRRARVVRATEVFELTLDLYEVSFDRWTSIVLPDYPPSSLVRFVRVSRSFASDDVIDIWIGTDNKLMKATCSDIDSVKRLNTTDWKNVAETVGFHNDSGYLGLDNYRKPVLYGSSGGLFIPEGTEDAVWHSAALKGSGLNSYKITDLAGTYALGESGKRYGTYTSLYITTDDNGIWASSDGGSTWPNCDFMSGFSLQAPKDAPLLDDVTVAYSKFDSGSNSNMFSDFYLAVRTSVPNIDMTGNTLSNLGKPFFISTNNWIRHGYAGHQLRDKKFVPHPPPEIYISQNNGSNWNKIADVQLEIRGGFTVSGNVSDPVIYGPFRGSKTDSDIHKTHKKKTKKKGSKSPSDEREIIGLLKLTGIYDSKIREYDEKDLIYLPDNGSLGLRATKFNTQAVYGVDPRNPNYIIAPDIYNQVVKVSHDGGAYWTTDTNLTDEVTNYGSLLLYDGDPYHMQVTQISFDPYDSGRIVVGTRDAGIIITKNGGTSWTTLPDSEQITYITNFFFRHDKSIIVSSYGRGLWEVDSRYFPFVLYCPADCNMRLPHDPKPLIYERIDWRDKDVFVFVNGGINGLILSQNKVKSITITPGTAYKRYPEKTANYRKIKIVESKNGAGFDGLKGCLAAIENGEIIKALILKENKIFGIISGKQEFKQFSE